MEPRVDCGSSAEWTARLLSGNATREESAQFQLHLASCVPCRESYSRAERTWNLLGQARPLSFPSETLQSLAVRFGGISQPRPSKRPVWVPWAAGLAAAGLLAVLAGILGRSPSGAQPTAAVTPPPPVAPPPAPLPPQEGPRDEVNQYAVQQLLNKESAPLPGRAPAPKPEIESPTPAPAPVPAPTKGEDATAPKAPERPAPVTPPQPKEETPKPERPQEKPAPPAPEEKRTVVIAALLDRAEGAVFLVSESGRSPARPGLPIPAGQGVVTEGPASHAVLEYPDGTRIALGANTILANIHDRQTGPGKSAEGKHFELLLGILAAQVPKQPAAEPLLISTPNAEARVLGTRFTLTVTPASTRLDVKEGRVRLTRKEDPASVDVGTDHHAVVAKGLPLVAKPSAGPKIVIREPFETPRVGPGLVFGGDLSSGLRMSPQGGALSLRVPAKAPPELPADGLTPGGSPGDLAKKATDNLVRSATMGSKSDLPRSMWLETRQVFALSNETPLRIGARLWQSHADPDRISWITLNRALPSQSLALERRGALVQLWSEGAQTVLWKKEIPCVQEWESLELWITKDQVVVRRNGLTLFKGTNPLKSKVVQIALGGNAKPELAQDEEARFDDLEISWVTRQDLDEVTK